MRSHQSALVLFFGFCLTAPLFGASSVRPVQLRCEYRRNPLGIDVTDPRLSWELAPVNPKSRGLRQTAYRIVASSSAPLLEKGSFDLWDTGRVTSDQSVQVVYRGRPMGSEMQAAWKVQVWDQANQPSDWSE